MFKKVNPKQNFPEQEHEIIEFWKKNKIFEKSVESRPATNKYVFVDGPPFITGTPHYGTLLGRIAKDVIPRYQTMIGKRVERQWGWDCHGLPIENKVEKELGLKNRRDIEKVGIETFIQGCYKYTRETSAEWEWYKDHIGQWVDFENAFRTMDQDSMETVMWVFKQLWEKKMIYEGTRVSLYCTRCGTPVSNFEIAMDDSYDIMSDPAITIKFPLKGEDNTFILAWTTTPWTLPSNRALVVAEDEDYVRVKRHLNIKKYKSVRAVIKNGDNIGIIFYGQDYTYSLPGGKPNDGESSEDALIRELKEETGFQNLKIAKKLGTLKDQYINKVNQINEQDTEVYLVELVDKQRNSPILTEKEKNLYKVNFEWKPLEEAKELLKLSHESEFLDITSDQAEKNVQGRTILNEEVDEYLILAKARLDYVFGIYGDEKGEYEVIATFKGKELIGKEYEPLYTFMPGNENDFKVYSFEGMVTMDDGTGIVHSAPGFGDIDTEMGDHYGLTKMFTVDDEGKFIKEISTWAGIYVKKADPLIISDLTLRNQIFKSERIEHRYPYCYRCNTPLIYRAQNSWFIDIKNLKPKMLKNNENINWVPGHFKEGRFKIGIESAPDWCISRTRYWATPMPVWRDTEETNNPETIVVGSRDELRKLANEPITKLILLNAGEAKYDELLEEGWEEARKIEKIFDHEVDVIVSADLKRCVETVEPLANGKESKEIINEKVFGSNELESVLKDRVQKLLKENDAETLSDVPEQTLEDEFKDDITYIISELNEYIKKYEGKEIVISTIPTIIALIRHSISGVTLRVAFRTNPEKGKYEEIYLDGTKELDLHKPYIDKFTIKSTETGKTLKRIFEVCDVWMESGSMPYAMEHYPFENVDEFEANFPADFVVEYISQTRAWFYVMHVLGSALFDSEAFKNVVVTGVMAGTDGRKMSKSYGNYPDPKETILKYGADPIRLYFMGSKLMMAEDVSFSEALISEQIKNILLPLWNSYSFFVTYANLFNFEPSPAFVQKKTDGPKWFTVPFDPKEKLNIWILSKLQLLTETIRNCFEEYNLPAAVKEYSEFLADLSKWYIRRSRSKFAAGDKESLETLYYVLVEFIKLLAPFAPFITESIYQNLVKGVLDHEFESIHLADFPDDDAEFVAKHEKVMVQMDIVREIVNLGQSLRVQNNLKVRQPLSEIEISFVLDPNKEIQLEQWMKDLIADELNVKLVDEDRKLNDYTGWVKAEGEKYNLKVSLNTKLNPELKREGMLRELVRGIQSQRKKERLDIQDFVRVKIISQSKDLQESFNLILEDLKTQVRGTEITLNSDNPVNKIIRIGEDFVDIEIEKV